MKQLGMKVEATFVFLQLRENLLFYLVRSTSIVRDCTCTLTMCIRAFWTMRSTNLLTYLLTYLMCCRTGYQSWANNIKQIILNWYHFWLNTCHGISEKEQPIRHETRYVTSHSTAAQIWNVESMASSYGQRSFAYSGPALWNLLPLTVRDPSLSLTQFCAQLKSVVFSRAPWYIFIAPPWQSRL